jgi:dUTP pyrophosphatase
MTKIPLKVKFLKESPRAQLPTRGSDGAAGLDLYASEAVVIPAYPGGIALVPTGLRMMLPCGYEAQVRPRSGLALKHGVTVLNSPGTIDEDYRGPVGVILINHGRSPFVIDVGDRIAQLVIVPCITRNVSCEEVETLDQTTRGSGGFGSTGK